jgi:hypothetical protein
MKKFFNLNIGDFVLYKGFYYLLTSRNGDRIFLAIAGHVFPGYLNYFGQLVSTHVETSIHDSWLIAY